MWLIVTHHTYFFSIDSVAEKNVDMESLVDDFVTFYVAGKEMMTLAVHHVTIPQVRRLLLIRCHLQRSLFISILKCLTGMHLYTFM